MTRRLRSSLLLALCAAALGGCDAGRYGGYAQPYTAPAYPSGYSAPLAPPVPYASPQPSGWGPGYPGPSSTLNDPWAGDARRDAPYPEGRKEYEQPWNSSRPEPPTTYRDEHGRWGEGYPSGAPRHQEFEGRGGEAFDNRWNQRPDELRRQDDRTDGWPEQGYGRPDPSASTWR